MDESKPPTPPSDFRLRSASERTSADIDTASPKLTNSGEFAAVARQGRAGQVEPCRNAPCDGRTVAVYYRNAAEVSEGFRIALHAMGVAVIQQLAEQAKLPVRGAKP
jgi:hypothetical protein